MTIPDYPLTSPTTPPPNSFKAAREAGNARVRVRWLPDDGDGTTGAGSRSHFGAHSS
jgi:hypothetical protein